MTDFSSLKEMTVLGEKLADLCEKASQVCSITDSINHEFKSVSQPVLDAFNVPKHKVIGNTMQKLILDTPHLNTATNEMHIRRTYAITQQTLSSKKTIITNKAVFTNHQGLIQVIRVIQTPIFNQKKKVIATVNYVNNLTKYYDILSLFNLYWDQYPPQQAILNFLKHLSLDQYFHQLPSYNEVLALLTLYFKKVHRQNIRLSQTGFKGPCAYVDQLTKKLIFNSLGDILYILNTQQYNKL